MCLLVSVLFLRNLNLTFYLYRLSLSLIPLIWCSIKRSTLANALWLMGHNCETSTLRRMKTVAWDNCHHLLLQPQTPKRSPNLKNHNQSLLRTNKWIIRQNTEEYNMAGKLTWAPPSRNHDTPIWRTIALQKIYFMRTKFQLQVDDGRRGFSCLIICMKYRDKLGFHRSWQKLTFWISILVLS